MQAPLVLSRALTQKIESHKNRIDLIQKNEQANTGKLDKFQERINDCLSTFENHKSEYQQYKYAIDEIDQRLKDSINGEETALLDLKKINDEIVDSDLKIQETRALVDGRIVGNKTLEFLEGAGKRGALKGLVGRLGDLGSVDKKYDVAVSNGFGVNWDAILFDTVENAMKGIQMLKGGKIGAASCMGLDQMTKKWLAQMQWSKENFKTPKDTMRVFDLITCRAEVQVAFFSVCQNVLTTEDVKYASHVMKQTKVKVVTHSGDVINPTGVFSGGGNKRIGQLGARVIDQATAERLFAELKGKLVHLSEKKQQALAIVDENSKIKADLTRDRQALTAILVPKKNLFDVAHKELDSVKAQKFELEKILVENSEKASLIKEINSFQKKLLPLQKKITEFESQITSIESEIESMSGGTLTEIRRSLDDLDKKLEISTNASSKLEQTILTLPKEIRSSQKEHSQLIAKQNLYEKRKEKSQIKVDDLEKLTLDVLREINKKESECHNFQSQIEEFDEKLKDIKSMFDEINLKRKDAENLMLKNVEAKKGFRDAKGGFEDQLEVNMDRFRDLKEEVEFAKGADMDNLNLGGVE